ncbi:MAG: hypothetical protein ACE5EV_02760, partial [Gaiellales bacterium]
MTLAVGYERTLDDHHVPVEIDRQHARLDERQEQPGIELDDVVRDAGGDVLHTPYGPTVVGLNRKANELERVVGPRLGIGQRFERHL